MKASELRIGNYLINQFGVEQQLVIENFCDFCFEGCKPIPLTEQRLLDFGFEKPAHSFIGDIFHLSEWDEFPNTWCVAMNKNNAIIFRRLKYVHQLQNLFYALRGEELTIKEKV
mgnify:CR=1 FL=1